MMKTVITDQALCRMLGIVSPEQNPRDYYLFRLLPEDFLTRIAAGDFKRDIYPRFSDREAWQRVASMPAKQCFVNSILERAEYAVNSPVVQLPYSLFCRYAVDGNRAEYENRFRATFAEQSTLALAMCLTGDKDKYLMPLLDRIVFMLERSTWCVPAHCAWTDDGVLKEHHRADLYSCLMAKEMGFVYRLLGDELEAAAEGIRERMRDKIYRESIGKVMDPATTQLCHWYHIDSSSNWVISCAGDCLMAAICVEEDTMRLAAFMQIFLHSISSYIYACPDDGFCCEGVSYFSGSGGYMFCVLDMLDLMMPGACENVFADSKIRAIVEFVAKMRFGAGFVCFSDCNPDSKIPYDLLHRGAERFDSALYRKLGADRERILYCPPDTEMMHWHLRNLFDVKEVNAVPNSDVPEQVLYKDCLGICHAGEFSLMVKSGNNQEMHNHNDLGHFAVCYGADHIVIDAGTGVYTRDNFSEKRYTIWNNSADSHNAPILDGVKQEEGAEYTSTLDLTSAADGSHTLVCDLGKAYPAEAGVRSFLRTATVAPDCVTVHDVIDWQGREAVINLYCTNKPENRSDGVLINGRVILRGEGIEVRETALQTEKFGTWQAPIYRITLATSAGDYKLIFSAAR